MNVIKNSIYAGVEIGPIRPPGEAGSLMLRVTRNCPWNKCRFCGLYAGADFSIRRLEHVLKDIDAVAACIEKIRTANARPGILGEAAADLNAVPATDLNAAPAADLNTEPAAGIAAGSDVASDVAAGTDADDAACDGSLNQAQAMESAQHWYANGMKSVFLQDANALLCKTEDLAQILAYLREKFPFIERITTYARSKTVVDKGSDAMKLLHDRGLNRIHTGMESGADSILKFMNKGATKEIHVRAGNLIRQAGI
jgi:radical SAM superfamily enzyme YgiQ (UPF0313 family)